MIESKNFNVIAHNNSELRQKLEKRFEGIINIINNYRRCLEVKRDAIGGVQGFLYRYKGTIVLQTSLPKCQNNHCYGNGMIEGNFAYFEGKKICQTCYKYLKKQKKSKKHVLIFFLIFFMTSVSALQIDLEYEEKWEINSTEYIKITILDDLNVSIDVDEINVSYNNTYLYSNTTFRHNIGHYEKMFFVKNMTGKTNISIFDEIIEIEIVKQNTIKKFWENLNNQIEKVFDKSGFVILTCTFIFVLLVLLFIFFILLKMTKNEKN